MNRQWTPLALREMSVKLHWDSILPQSKWQSLRKHITNTGRDVNKMELSFTTAGKLYRSQRGVSQKARNRSSMWLGSPGPYPEDSKSAYRGLTHVYCSAPQYLGCGSKLRVRQLSSGEGMCGLCTGEWFSAIETRGAEWLSGKWMQLETIILS